ncbi:ADP-ribose pyrophosphatase, mitochondrial [Araneus ventricosus]|uniref:ADP-ribose pyrophosphatase, mitochondrial n=1 Tax=Araneus ventricosus TaxID=182803 RepID=A0A4Y2GWG0_ARAVE|nr:ADP-ribose pyrophosphatase, mitochondrial [Araneus ventricosus]
MKMLGQYSTFLCSALREELNAVCRNSNVYPVKRMVVPKDKVSWGIPWPEYTPPNYSASHLSNASWADPDIADVKFKPKWNEDDEGIDRRSYDQNETIKYEVIDGCPLNPRGRTGLSGRGRLGRWGPNHAGDAIVSRWKYLNGEKQFDAESGLPILQFIAILRKDCNKWAIPGGFVDPKEASSSAVLRELFEEAINVKKLSDEVQMSLKEFFKNGRQVYRGYVDDPRNTDNAWIETTAINFHDESGQHTGNVTLDARDDAADVKWIDIVKDMDIYPPHYAIIEHLKNLLFAET